MISAAMAGPAMTVEQGDHRDMSTAFVSAQMSTTGKTDVAVPSAEHLNEKTSPCSVCKLCCCTSSNAMQPTSIDASALSSASGLAMTVHKISRLHLFFRWFAGEMRRFLSNVLCARFILPEKEHAVRAAGQGSMAS